jgi:hypothetical protein
MHVGAGLCTLSANVIWALGIRVSSNPVSYGADLNMTSASLIVLCYKCPTRCAPDFGKPMGYEVLRHTRRIRAASVISENRQQYGLG